MFELLSPLALNMLLQLEPIIKPNPKVQPPLPSLSAHHFAAAASPLPKLSHLQTLEQKDV